MSDKKFKVGDKVKYKGNKHNMFPSFYPEVGSIGTIVEIIYDVEAGNIGTIDDVYECCIQWAKNSTSGDDKHWCSKNDIELVEDTDMTNEEIWKMLENKMEKNGLISNIYPCTKVDDNGALCFYLEEAYKANDVHNAIALAYKVGYLRAMKGRPFKIGEKKKKGGHWEPIDPNNLPKEWTKVRYVRRSKNYTETRFLELYDTGVVKYKDSCVDKWFGMEPDVKRWKMKTWIYLENIIECFDMWVEDNE